MITHRIGKANHHYGMGTSVHGEATRVHVEFTRQELAATCNTIDGLRRGYGETAVAVRLALSVLQAAEGSMDALPNVTSEGEATVIRTSTADVVLDIAVNNGTATISRIRTRPLNGQG